MALVGHSLGCNTIVCWAEASELPHALSRAARLPFAGALLVAPSDCEDPGYPREPAGFTPVPLSRLPFPSIVVASSDDPFASLDRARLFASSWGSRFIDVGPRGHLNSASKLGLWPEGHALLHELLAAWQSCAGP